MHAPHTAAHPSQTQKRATPVEHSLFRMAAGEASLVAHNELLGIPQSALRVAGCDCTVLITGETGVGKGHVARWMHARSPRRNGPLVPVNCGAIPEDLVDSHLFGHARGSFSGASTAYCGMVRAAEGGTLFLDEVGDLPPSAQRRLLRLLEEREVQPVGVAAPVRVNVRVIAASNRSLTEAVSAGTFRSDLLYRLDVLRVHIGPLRARIAEIAPLTDLLNEQVAAIHGHEPLVFDDSCRRAIEEWHWPGNVRELRTVIERLHVLCGSGASISREDLIRSGQVPLGADAKRSGTRRLAADVGEVRASAIARALAAANGNVSRAAALLGVHRSTLYRAAATRASGRSDDASAQ